MPAPMPSSVAPMPRNIVPRGASTVGLAISAFFSDDCVTPQPKTQDAGLEACRSGALEAGQVCV